MAEALTVDALPPTTRHDILVNGHPATVLIGAQGTSPARR
jgi:hypothetical protein